MTEVQNLLQFKVYTAVEKTTADGHNIFLTLMNFLTKRTKDSTPQIEVIDKRKTRIVFGGHRCIAGRDFCRLDAYAPVPTWGQVKLRLAMAAIHGLKLKAFDCIAVYLQTPMEKALYVRPSKGLMELHGEDKDSVWQLNKDLYGYPVASSLCHRIFLTYLRKYGFVPLSNSATFPILRQASGIIWLNVYSDDGLGANDDETLWQEVMQDFKSKFELEEKAPDYFLGAGIVQGDSSAIHLDSSKHVCEMLAKYDMDSAVRSPLSMPARSLVYMPADDDDIDSKRTKLFPQLIGSIL